MAFHRSIAQHDHSIQSTANLRHENTTISQINYQSDSSYSDYFPPSVMAPHSHSSHTPPALSSRLYHSPEPESDHTFVKRTSTRLKSSRAVPYSRPQHKSVDIGPQVSSRVQETHFLPRLSAPSGTRQDTSSDYYDYTSPSVAKYHDKSRSMDNNDHVDTRKASYYSTSSSLASDAPTLALPQRTTRSIVGTTEYTSPVSYAAAQDASLYPDTNPNLISRYGITEFRGADHQLAISNARRSTTGTSQSQPQNYVSSVGKTSHYNNRYDGWQFDHESGRAGSAAVSYPPGPDPLDSIPRQHNTITYDVGRGYYCDPDWYARSHHFQDQSGAGSLGNETLDSYTEPYLGLQNYVVYGEGLNQVSRRWLHMAASSYSL